eukprot:TRINITY_DN5321_c0_g1_i1.p1 TRINITY_DN5321_c0_g1~~TRINITY_DN5321_c0_g1_i1.p1  ORF type:complete len:163 (-),score=34.96 TRINITY_DN5321_c0_g1_i1:391-879(-)
MATTPASIARSHSSSLHCHGTAMKEEACKAYAEKDLMEHRWRITPKGIAQGPWVCIHGLVLLLPSEIFIKHPGGANVLQEVAGKDATAAFEMAGHSNRARQWATTLIIGNMEGTSQREGLSKLLRKSRMRLALPRVKEAFVCCFTFLRGLFRNCKRRRRQLR